MSTHKFRIKCFTLGPWATNCYVVRAGSGGAGDECWVVDAGFEPQEMIQFITQENLLLRKIILTHAHLDHIAGLSLIREQFPQVPIAIHRAEADFLTDPELNLSALLEEPIIAPPADELLDHGGELQLSGLRFQIRHTPGHSPGGITLYQAEMKVALVGDALFASSIGRYDFPTSNRDQLMASLREQLMTLPDDTQVLPGHGPATTIGKERRGNPYLQQ